MQEVDIEAIENDDFLASDVVVHNIVTENRKKLKKERKKKKDRWKKVVLSNIVAGKITSVGYGCCS